MSIRLLVAWIRSLFRSRVRVPPVMRRHVVVKFRDHVDVPYVDGIESRLDEFNIGAGAELLEAFPGIQFRRSYASVDPAQLRKAMAAGAPNYFTFFTVKCPRSVDARALAKALREWPIVEAAYVPRPTIPSSTFDPSGNPMWRSGAQGYLAPAPLGIDAAFAWSLENGHGEGQTFADVEHGWHVNHEDLIAAKPILVSGINIDVTQYHHGAAVLGVIVAANNDKGIVGIAPSAAPRLASIYSVPPFDHDLHFALLGAIAALSAGDVLLIEEQLHTELPFESTWPIEIELQLLADIQFAVSKGIIVVEGAANAGSDLKDWDGFVDGATLGHSLDPDDKDYFKDSGAIIVGAASALESHSGLNAGKVRLSNYGKRVDCYAWGEDVATCWLDKGHDPLFDTHDYSKPPEFGMTSAASAIIAGVVLVIQGLAEKHLSRRFTPGEMRDLLRNPALGTPSADPAVDLIGNMPDLQRIILSQLKSLAPRIYIRDSPADVGEPGSSGFLSASPDIILRSARELDPQKTWGEGSGTESSALLSEDITAGTDHFVYVRARNKGSAPAENVLATVFVAPAATFVSPTLWSPLGNVLLPKVPVGDRLTVSNAIVWPAIATPPPGHYCFIGMIGNATLPAPKPEAFLDLNAFLDFVRNNVQVTWRNFNVVPAKTTAPHSFAFLAPGAPDRDRIMSLEVMSTLPRDARIMLNVPAVLRGGDGEVPVHPNCAYPIGEFLFPRDARPRLRLQVDLPANASAHPYEIAVRQLFEGQELGRVTWRLLPSPARQRATKASP